MPRVTKKYSQTFTTASSVVITHNLGHVPEAIIALDNSADILVIDTTTHDSLNQTTITFSAPQTGSVQVAVEVEQEDLAGSLTYDIGKANLQGEHLIEVRNETGSTIVSGKAVYQSGYSTTYAVPLVALADNTSDNTMPAIGITIGSIDNNKMGYVAVMGIYRNSYNTSTFTARDILYIGTSGDLTNVRPARAQRFASVIYAAASGKIYIKEPFDLSPDDKYLQYARTGNVGAGVSLFVDQGVTTTDAVIDIPGRIVGMTVNNVNTRTFTITLVKNTVEQAGVAVTVNANTYGYVNNLSHEVAAGDRLGVRITATDGNLSNPNVVLHIV